MVQSIEERLKSKKESAKKYRDNNKDKKKEYYQNNKEQIAEMKREYYQNNKEQIAEKHREHYQNNKEHIADKQREYYQNNKEQIAEKDKKRHKKYRQNNKEKIADEQREHRQTPAGKKSTVMDNWRRRGIINVTDEMYNHYIAATHCECCSKEFSSSRDRHLDHDHETGEYRQILCCSCNTHDHWKKIIHSVSQY